MEFLDVEEGPKKGFNLESDLEEQLFERLPKLEEITQGQVELLSKTEKSTDLAEDIELMKYFESLTQEQQKILIERTKQLYRPAK